MRPSLQSLCALLMVAALATPGPAGAERLRPHATLYESVENMVEDDGQRLAIAALQGTAEFDTPFCPANLLQARGIRNAERCTVTAFGEDIVNGRTGAGVVSAVLGMVVNDDNPVDPAERLILSGTITGDLQVVPWEFVTPRFGSRKKALGPVAPFILLTNGQFRPDATPMLPQLGSRGAAPATADVDPCELPACAPFTAIFRLPFTLGRDGDPEAPTPGRPFFYLADDGRLIRVKRRELFGGLPVPRAEVRFPGVSELPDGESPDRDD